MAVIGLEHVQLAIRKGGESQARAFYGQILGLTEVAKPSNLSPSGCWFAGGALNLHLGVDPDFTPATKAHPALLVDDLAAMRERIEAAGFEVKGDKSVPGFDRFFTNDPFGNRIEIMQALAPE